MRSILVGDESLKKKKKELLAGGRFDPWIHTYRLQKKYNNQVQIVTDGKKN
jgi:hypothetical protein